MTFALDPETNAPYVVNWKNQTIDLSSAGSGSDYYINSNGITKDKKVNSYATYEALKDDPDWYATGVDYSRYNHDSAVATINSLPDTITGGGGSNTIKFDAICGEAYGKAIHNLTEEEIAVATAKGWTVSLS
jgi:hypothetical protein